MSSARLRLMAMAMGTNYANEYLTFKALESGTFKFAGNAVNYSIDGGSTWVSLADGTDTPTINAGDTIKFKATITPNSTIGCGTFSSTGRYEAMGNPYSLIYGDNFKGVTTLTDKTDVCKKLFYGSVGLVTAENLSLPAIAIGQSFYESMFHGCTSLTTPPKIPATSVSYYGCFSMFRGCTSLTSAPVLPATNFLSSNTYARMFYGCTGLTTAPELPATTLSSYCYYSMFQGCTGLTTAPTLPATTLKNYCYYQMFQDCTHLNSITMLATDISATNCLNSWVNNVASTGTFVKAASMTSLPSGASGIPSGWTVEDES